jgi:hypothetical protein
MTNLVTDFREALVADLQLEFPDADVLSGIRTGKAVDRAKIAVFWPGTREMQGRVVVGEARIVVRYWPVSAKVRDQSTAGVRDPGELEQAAWDLQTFLQTKQTSYGASGAWFCRLVSVEPDYDPDEWGVEAVIAVMFDNPAVIDT